MIVSSRVPIADCGLQLEFDSEGNMQFSDPWIVRILHKLPDDSQARQAIQRSMKNDTLRTCVAGVDTVTGEFQMISVNARDM